MLDFTFEIELPLPRDRNDITHSTIWVIIRNYVN